MWRDHVVPARRAFGFAVEGGWLAIEGPTFVWLVGHQAPDGWDAVETAYYGSPLRRQLPRDPLDLIESYDVRLMREA